MLKTKTAGKQIQMVLLVFMVQPHISVIMVTGGLVILIQAFLLLVLKDNKAKRVPLSILAQVRLLKVQAIITIHILIHLHGTITLKKTVNGSLKAIFKAVKAKREIAFLLLAVLRLVKTAQWIHIQLHSQTVILRHLTLLMVRLVKPVLQAPLVKTAQMVLMVILQSSRLVVMVTGLSMVLILVLLLVDQKVKQVQMVME